MTGRHSGVGARMQVVAPDATWGHYSIHREALAAKGMPDSLKDVLGTTVNTCIFSALCNDTGSNHVMLL